jgi:hypothetical protein
VGVRSLASWLSVSAQIQASEGKYAGAIQDLERVLAMANAISRGGCLINHLVGMTCDSFAAGSMWWISVREDLPASVLKQGAHTFLASADSVEPYVEAVRAEALYLLNAVPHAYRTGSFEAPLDVTAPTIDGLGRLAIQAFALAGSTPNATTRNLEACYQRVVVLAGKPYCARTEAEYEAFETDPRFSISAGSMWDLLRLRDPLGHVMACQLVPYTCGGAGHAQAAERDAQLRGIALFLAVKAYEKRHGAIPERLEELVPDYLARVPSDPFDGKPMRYRRDGVPNSPAGTWAVYSIGKDFTDDGGTAQSIDTLCDGSAPNPDLVWPSQPYPPQAAGK